jgi:Ca2+-binding RTX toxin-like protein
MNTQFTQIGTDNTNSLYGDYLIGDSQVDVMDGLGGDDYLFGNAGDDILYGWTGNDTVEGGEGSDILYGQDGSDRLIGADYRGNYFDYPELEENRYAFANEPIDPDLVEVDDFYGGANADTFVLGDYFNAHYRGSGFAVIRDFNPAEGDKLEVFGELENYSLGTGDLAEDGINDLLLEYQGETIAVLTNYTGNLVAEDFVSSQASLGYTI